MSEAHETIVVLDFGSQYTQLIARRIRDAGVYCEILPYHVDPSEIEKREPRGIILSGGPDSVFGADSPHPHEAVYEVSTPLLGICYGMQLMAHKLGGNVHAATERQYGPATLEVLSESRILQGIPRSSQVWMSHGDNIKELPSGFQIVARAGGTIAAFESLDKQRYGVQFHPEVAHTAEGEAILRNFLFEVCECRGDWTVRSFIDEAVERIKSQVKEGLVLCGLSGGVDSTVAAVLVQRAVGDRLTCVFVDNGLLRKNEFEAVLKAFDEQIDLNIVGVEAGDRFLSRLEGVVDPELKRKRIGEEFIRVFEEQADPDQDYRYLVQGTLYPDVIESVSVKGPSAAIKSHHNVGGLPKQMDLELVEPLRELFKDEVRRLGRALKIPDPILQRHPFPGPGLAIRILGEVNPEKLQTLREADQIVLEEIRRAGLYTDVWQAFAVLLPVQTVGVMGDDRTYENVVAVRIVDSTDGMTANWAKVPYEVLATMSSRIVNEVRGINRVVYDISSKPPSTIEWE